MKFSVLIRSRILHCSLVFGLILTNAGPAHAKFQMTKASSSRRKIPKVSLHEIQILDSQIQALNSPIDTNLNSPIEKRLDRTATTESSKSATAETQPACAIDAKTRESMLSVKRQILDQKIADFVAPKIHAQGSISIADSSWPKECARNCHCAVYKSILEAAGSERLSENDRRTYQKLTDLAMNQPVSERAECAREGLKEICKLEIRK